MTALDLAVLAALYVIIALNVYEMSVLISRVMRSRR
jgi:hypothetical protein